MTSKRRKKKKSVPHKRRDGKESKREIGSVSSVRKKGHRGGFGSGSNRG